MIKTFKQRVLSFDDDLLYLGLKVFGFEDFQNIKTFYLPHKTQKQLLDRVRYLSTRHHTENNAVKTLSIQPFKNFLIYEFHILIQVIFLI